MKKKNVFLNFAFCLLFFIFSFNRLLAKSSSIIITELLPNPEGKDSQGEFIELYNQSEETIDLTGWAISDKIGQSKEFVFPKGSFIPGQGFVLLNIKETKINLNNEGDKIVLKNELGEIIDSVEYKDLKEGLSYSKGQDGWLWVAPTPNRPNLFPKINPEKETAVKEEKAEMPNEKTLVSGNNLAIFFLALFIALGSAVAVFFFKK